MGEENIKLSEGTMFIDGKRVELGWGTVSFADPMDTEDPAPVRMLSGETIEFESEITTINEDILDMLTGGLHRIKKPTFEDRIKLHKRVSRKRYIKLLMSHGLSRNEAEFSAFMVRSLGHPYYYTQQFTMF